MTGMQEGNRYSLPRVGAVVLLALTAGCSGQLILPAERFVPCDTSSDCGIGRVCDATRRLCVASAGPCSREHPSGDCPMGLACSGGYCLCVDPVRCNCSGECAVSWCACTPEQGCADGVCVDIVDDNECTPDHPQGLCTENRACCEGGATCCAGGEVCVGDHCVPNTQPCSPEILSGWCENGMSCLGGRCVPTSTCTCSESNPTGCCPAGYSCQGGVCSVTECVAGVVGVCPVDMVCGALGCESLPCSANHTSGACSGDDVCSHEGSCIPPNTCLVDVDCPSPEGQYCSTERQCLQRGLCAADGDCTTQQAETFGQGFMCTNSQCVARTTCTLDTECMASQFCSVGGHCLSVPNCDGLLDCSSDGSSICGVHGTCLTLGTCLENADCTEPNSFCGSNGHCLVEGQCAVANDCPPMQYCSTTSSPGVCTAINAGSCDSNVIVNTPCTGGALDCCESGGTCCSAGQRCSSATNCIPIGMCVDDTDCLSGNTTCEDHVCVPQRPCDQCTTGQKCSTRVVSGVWVSGCIAEDRCLSSLDCATGEYCASNFTCHLSAGCDHEVFTTGGTVAPNVLMVVDRSGSMNICGPGNSEAGPCGYNDGPCTTTANCTGSFPNDICYNPTSQPNAGICIDISCTAGAPPGDGPCTTTPDCTGSFPTDVCYNPTGQAGAGACVSTTPRWDEAYQAVTYLVSPANFGSRINFGLSMFPKPNHRACDDDSDCGGRTCDGVFCVDVYTDACTQDCRYTTCNGSGNFNPGVIDVGITGDAATRNAAILNAMSGTAPGGSTPTAPTLRAITASADRGGLKDLSRVNAVLLVTDGEAVDDTVALSLCAAPCADGTKNGDETGIDCGGSCDACATGYGCAAATDCASSICRGGFCRATSCANSSQDGDETDIDCGGDCGPCADELGCELAADCISQVCTSNVCIAAACDDTLKNGDETALDCGGPCAAKCAIGSGCDVAADCSSSVCQAGVCRDATCDNHALDSGTETAVDCGGSCGPCAVDATCDSGSDCQSGYCPSGTCQKPLCNNGTLEVGNGETDIDCGGTNCAPCGPYRTCSVGADCVGTTPVCSSYSVDNVPVAQGARVNAAIARLYSETPRVRTFVVGFNLGAVSSSLNCHAVYGRTARRDQGSCASLTTDDCATSGDTCYYEATNQSSLQTTFSAILTEVSACSYDASTLEIENTSLLYVYLQDALGARTRVQRGPGGWQLIPGTPMRIDFYDQACARLRNDNVQPVVAAGCSSGG